MHLQEWKDTEGIVIWTDKIFFHSTYRGIMNLKGLWLDAAICGSLPYYRRILPPLRGWWLTGPPVRNTATATQQWRPRWMDAASRHRGTDSRSPLRLEGGRIRERFGPFLMAIEGKDSPLRSAPKKLNWERINQDQMSRHGIFSQSYLELCQGILLRMVASTQFGASCKRGSRGFRGEHMSRIVAGRGECSRELPDLLPSSSGGAGTKN